MELQNDSVGASGPRKSLTGQSCQGEGSQALSLDSISVAILQSAGLCVGGRLHSHSKGRVDETGHREGNMVEVRPPHPPPPRTKLGTKLYAPWVGKKMKLQTGSRSCASEPWGTGGRC